jgi:MarR family transcriptional regulator, transcriptional regulator for hemolysin
MTATLRRPPAVQSRTAPANRYTLTEAGEAAAGEVERSHRRFQQQLLAGVAEHDRQAVLRVLRQFRANATIEET